MSIDEVLCQISTFLAAGHETTCSALTWCLYALAKDQRVQSKLRDVLRGIQDQLEENVRHDVQELGYHQETLTNHILTCTYLDWVVRECLRLHAPVTNTMRVCMRDYDEIPLLHPINLPRHAGERICVPPEDAMGLNEGASNIHHDKHGNQIPVALGISFSETHRRAGGSKRTAATTVPIRKWDIISVPIQAINKSEMFWGEDGGMFRCGLLSLLICRVFCSLAFSFFLFFSFFFIRILCFVFGDPVYLRHRGGFFPVVRGLLRLFLGCIMVFRVYRPLQISYNAPAY